MSKPSLPQGTRDFGPDIVCKRNYIFNTIREVFELYGFQPLETPAMENLDTLMGKYGEEGDKLIFKILNNGLDHPSKQEQVKADFQKILEGKSVKTITERALKYDLTIPFARYVATHHHQLTFPFKRYQMQPVWRADRPQKGRYREFYQCDADVVGSNALLNEVELIYIYYTVFSRLGIDVKIHINNRKVLTGIAEIIGEPDRIVDITTAIDKVDKIEIEGVKNELRSKGFSEAVIKKLIDLIFIEAGKVAVLSPYAPEDPHLRILYFMRNGTDYRGSAIFQEGVKELEDICTLLGPEVRSKVQIDFSLARGLNYYTGTIFEVKASNVQMGSIGGGGRYDDLTGLFGVSGIPGVGISFGVDRIYDVMEELNLFDNTVQIGTQVLFFNLGETESRKAFELMQQLRNKGIRAELFHETVKFDKQFKYAEKKNISYAIIIGSKELEAKTCVIKNINTGVQQTITMDKLSGFSFG